MSVPGVPQLSQAAQGLANLALVTPLTNIGYQPINVSDGSNAGTPWFFHAELDNEVDLEAEFPDSYLEDNSSAQDHGVLHPEIITVRALTGEVTVLAPEIASILAVTQNVLQLVSAYSPAFSQSALNTLNQTNAAYQQAKNAARGAVSAFNTLSGAIGANVINGNGQIQTSSIQTQQQAIFTQMYGFWRQQANPANPIWFQVQTPYAIFTPTALISCKAKQGPDSNMVSEFTLTFKMIRIVDDSTPSLVSVNRAASFASPTVNNGVVVPSSAPDVSTMLPAVP